MATKQWPCQEPRVSPDGRAAGGQRQGNEAAAEGRRVRQLILWGSAVLLMESGWIDPSTMRVCNGSYGSNHLKYCKKM